MLGEMGLRKLALETAEAARERNAWNYDPIEVAANTAVAQAFEDFADRLIGLED